MDVLRRRCPEYQSVILLIRGRTSDEHAIRSCGNVYGEPPKDWTNLVRGVRRDHSVHSRRTVDTSLATSLAILGVKKDMSADERALFDDIR
jgi:hypothetical protein